MYEKALPRLELAEGQRVYLEFQGLNASACVELNEQTVGTHDGGHSTIQWSGTDFLPEENQLAVRVDNSRSDRVHFQKRTSPSAAVSTGT